MDKVKDELNNRSRLTPKERAKREDEPSTWYDEVYDLLPKEFQSSKHVPKKLASEGAIFGLGSKKAKFSENLKNVVVLVKVILQSGLFAAASAQA